jgi:hypothetical protein
VVTVRVIEGLIGSPSGSRQTKEKNTIALRSSSCIAEFSQRERSTFGLAKIPRLHIGTNPIALWFNTRVALDPRRQDAALAPKLFGQVHQHGLTGLLGFGERLEG